MKKPELLLPAGSVESFYAAAEGGADAVYLGLRQFNARERARNFTFGQYKALLKEARARKIKIYLTLNTLIKNNELPELLDVLNTIKRDAPDAVIIQDLGLLYLLRNYFPSLEVHASTQMALHNSQGVNFAAKAGIERAILARELSLDELSMISKKSQLDLELFIHGALCYSFSGMCLFSSYLGGMSANRGNCRQPCRRQYSINGSSNYAFNLKDNQQAENLKKIMKTGVASLKVEGRMKSAEYVYQVAKAYRLLIDHPGKYQEAAALLENDLGRQKTSYFLGNSVKEAISELPYTGKLLGRVAGDGKPLRLELNLPLHTGDRIRILGKDGFDAKSQRVAAINQAGKSVESATGIVTLPESMGKYHSGDKVFLSGTKSLSFPSQLKKIESNKIYNFSRSRAGKIISDLAINKPPKHAELFIRINDPAWLRKVYIKEIDHIILNLTLVELENLNLKTNFWRDNINKLIIQLPRFISEKSLPKWKKELDKLQRIGISSFMLSHISQTMFFHSKKTRLFTSENVYVLNDAAQKFLRDNKITNWIYPFENDFPNLTSGKDRRGIVPLFFYPELFFSRMPVDLPENELFADSRQNFVKHTKAGITIIVPQHPVSLLQFHTRLIDKGFRRFMIDFSYTSASSNYYNKIIKTFRDSQPYNPATSFNFKMGLK